MRVKLNGKPRSFATEDRCVGAVEQYLGPALDEHKATAHWIVVNHAGKYTPVFFLKTDAMWLARSISEHGWMVVG